MYRPMLIALFLFSALLPVHATVRMADQPHPGAQENTAFVDLARLELDHDFWEKLLAPSADPETEPACYRPYFNLEWLPSLISTSPLDFERKLERYHETIKAGFLYLAKEIVPAEFWEEQLAKFYATVLTLEEAESIVLLYPDRADTPTETQLQQLRIDYCREFLPNLMPQIRNMAQSFKIPSGGMAPTLLIGDYIVVDKLAYRDQSPSRGDVIVFRYPEDESKTFVKRIIGVPKDRLEIRDQIVYLNDQAFREDYILHVDSRIIEKALNPRDNIGPLAVPENAYFVLGDNREESLDSRFWGYLKRDQIIGKVSIIYWSWDETGKTARWERAGLRIH